MSEIEKDTVVVGGRRLVKAHRNSYTDDCVKLVAVDHSCLEFDVIDHLGILSPRLIGWRCKAT